MRAIKACEANDMAWKTWIGNGWIFYRLGSLFYSVL